MRKKSVQETIAKLEAKLEIEKIRDQLCYFQERYQNYEKKQILLNELANLSKLKSISFLFKEKPYLTTAYIILSISVFIAFLIGNVFIFISSLNRLEIGLSVVSLNMIVVIASDALLRSSVYVTCILSKEMLLIHLKELESSKKWCLKEIEELQKEAQRYAKEKE